MTEQQKDNLEAMFLSDDLADRVAAWYISRGFMSDFEICCFVWGICEKVKTCSIIRNKCIHFESFGLDHFDKYGFGCYVKFGNYKRDYAERKGNINTIITADKYKQYKALKPLITKL